MVKLSVRREMRGKRFKILQKGRLRAHPETKPTTAYAYAGQP